MNPSKRYYEGHKDVCNARTKAWKLKNADRVREYQRAYMRAKRLKAKSAAP